MITLEMAKYQCRIEHNADDELLQHYIKAVMVHTKNFIDDTVDFNNPAIIQAMLLLIGHWYENREAVNNDYQTPTKIPFGYEALLQPYRKMGV